MSCLVNWSNVSWIIVFPDDFQLSTTVWLYVRYYENSIFISFFIYTFIWQQIAIAIANSNIRRMNELKKKNYQNQYNIQTPLPVSSSSAILILPCHIFLFFSNKLKRICIKEEINMKKANSKANGRKIQQHIF